MTNIDLNYISGIFSCVVKVSKVQNRSMKSGLCEQHSSKWKLPNHMFTATGVACSQRFEKIQLAINDVTYSISINKMRLVGYKL